MFRGVRDTLNHTPVSWCEDALNHTHVSWCEDVRDASWDSFNDDDRDLFNDDVIDFSIVSGAELFGVGASTNDEYGGGAFVAGFLSSRA